MIYHLNCMYKWSIEHNLVDRMYFRGTKIFWHINFTKKNTFHLHVTNICTSKNNLFFVNMTPIGWKKWSIPLKWMKTKWTIFYLQKRHLIWLRNTGSKKEVLTVSIWRGLYVGSNRGNWEEGLEGEKGRDIAVISFQLKH